MNVLKKGRATLIACVLFTVGATSVACDPGPRNIETGFEEIRGRTCPIDAPECDPATVPVPTCDVGDVLVTSQCNPNRGSCGILQTREHCEFGCANGACQPNQCLGIQCQASANVCAENVCNPRTGRCEAVKKADRTACDDGNVCTNNTFCVDGTCGNGTLTQDMNPPQVGQCQGRACDPVRGWETVARNGIACEDGSVCTQGDTCAAGACVPGMQLPDPVQGPAPICQQRACDPVHGWKNENVLDGSFCGDGNACTQIDICRSGSCVGTIPTVCSASDQCHAAGLCDPATGACSNPLKANGSACDDANGCTQTDTCQAGACQGSNPIVCQASDGCHAAGLCDPATGQCSTPNRADGTQCVSDDRCMVNTTCTGGVCGGGVPAVDSSPNAHGACEERFCDPTTGFRNRNLGNGTACTSENLCKIGATCQAGACVGGQDKPDPAPVTTACKRRDCDPAVGWVDVNLANGSTCNDGNACTNNTVCTAGVCDSGSLTECGPSEMCREGGTCQDLPNCNPLNDDGGQGELGGDCAVYRETAFRKIETQNGVRRENYGFACGRERFPDGSFSGINRAYWGKCVVYASIRPEEVVTFESDTLAVVNNGISGCQDKLDGNLNGTLDASEPECNPPPPPCNPACSGGNVCSQGVCIPPGTELWCWDRDETRVVNGANQTLPTCHWNATPDRQVWSPNLWLYEQGVAAPLCVVDPRAAAATFYPNPLCCAGSISAKTCALPPFDPYP